jgi:hypothetical protein
MKSKLLKIKIINQSQNYFYYLKKINHYFLIKYLKKVLLIIYYINQEVKPHLSVSNYLLFHINLLVLK